MQPALHDVFQLVIASPLDMLWVVLSALLVFVMQAGFLCLEAGFTRGKNNINVALKNYTDLSFAVFVFWLVGYSLMFGPSLAGWIGRANLGPDGTTTSLAESVFFLFQVMFCSTAVTILSGAVAERMRFQAYIAIAILVSGLIYPIAGHWAWNTGFTSPVAGWLAERGFVDFAGSTVVHSVGGWVALAAVLIIGPRAGRFAPDGTRRQIPGSNLPLATLGVLLLWFGWFGFNGGSTLALDERVPGILINTLLGGVSGVVMVTVLSWAIRKQVDAYWTLNGAVSGLVAVTANCHAVPSIAAIVIGAVGAVIAVLTTQLLEHWRIDDAVGAIPAHLSAGIWGTLAVAVFGDLSLLGNGLNRWQQFEIQMIGVLAIGVWAFGVTYGLLLIMQRLLPLRVSPEDEYVGLNISEHQASTEFIDLFRVMDEQSKTQNLSMRVPIEPFTEVGQIAQRYNLVMEKLEAADVQLRGQNAEQARLLQELQQHTAAQARLIEENEQQRLAIRDMSVPILPVAASILVMPLIGALDGDRLTLVQERALEAIHQSSARYLLVDITGVSAVDMQIAQGLVETGHAIKLLGAQPVLVGVRPEVAETLVELGHDFNLFQTAMTLADGLQMLISSQERATVKV